MSYPATTRALHDVLALADAEALKVRAVVQSLRDSSAVGNVGRQSVVDLVRLLDRAITAWDAAAGRSGIAAYAQAQKGNASLDIAAEFAAMRAEAVSLRDWIVANFPRDASSGAALIWTYDASGTPTELTFTSAQLAPFRTRADSFIASIS